VNDNLKVYASDIEELVKASQAGDRGSFDEIVRLYQRRSMQIAGTFCIYGGPFLHFVDGDYDTDISDLGSLSFDMEHESEFGAYIGTQVDISTNSLFNIEAQFTGDAWVLSFGIGWRF
jgi:hypothetical protein